MEQVAIYVGFFCLIVIIGQIFSNWWVPLALLLVIIGMLLSFIPHLPTLTLQPNLVLNIFLPSLVYQVSAFSSWKDFKKNIRPISLLSIGHVIFITLIVAVIFHKLINGLSWPLAFVLGAIISPPDDVAIVSIAEKIKIPSTVISILEGEGMLNDAAALTIFRLALAAELTHQFLLQHAIMTFLLILVGETLYGFFIGFVLGRVRQKITSAPLHFLASLLTPFIAYYPPVMLGGSGIISVVLTGFLIGNVYSPGFTPQFRLIGRAMWPALAFGIQSFLYLLVGLDMRTIVKNITAIPFGPLFSYIGALLGVIIIGRFVWVYTIGIYIPKIFFKLIHKKPAYKYWQLPFLISWAGIRGSISLAAALAIPFLPETINGANARDLLIFLVFSVIVFTFVVQGLALPGIIKLIGVEKISQCEQFSEHVAELKTRKKMIVAVLRWLKFYKKQIKPDKRLYEEVKIHIDYYQMQKVKLKERLFEHTYSEEHDEEAELIEDASLQFQILEIERAEVLGLWRKGEISLAVREKLLDQLDHFARNIR